MKRLLLAAGIAIAPAVAFAQGNYLDIMGIIRGDSLEAQFGKKVVSAEDVNQAGAKRDTLVPFASQRTKRSKENDHNSLSF